MYRNFSHHNHNLQAQGQRSTSLPNENNGQLTEMSLDELPLHATITPVPPTQPLPELPIQPEFDIQTFDSNKTPTQTVEDKLNMMSFNNSWNDKNEKIIVSLGENAASYKWMHEKCASKYLFYNKVMNVTLTVFNTGLSAQTLVSEGNQAVVIASKVFIYLVTLLSVLMNFLKYQDLAAKHTNTASKFGELYHDIQQQMCLYRKDRKDAVKYTQDILKLYDSLVVGGPEIIDSVLTEFKNIFKNAEISVPDIADKIQKIEIISEPAIVSKSKSKQVRFDNNNVYVNQRSIPFNARKDSLAGGLQQLHRTNCSLQIDDDISDQDMHNRSREMYEMERYRKHLVNEM